MSTFTYQKVPKQVHLRNWLEHFAPFFIHGQEEETGKEASNYNEVLQACIYREQIFIKLGAFRKKTLG